MRGIEGASAQREIAVAEDPVRLEPAAVVAEAADESDGDDLGERRPRVGKRPYTTTKAEVEEHNPFHVHYRSWCPHCVAGRSISQQHIRQAAYEEAMGITMSVDYGLG